MRKAIDKDQWVRLVGEQMRRVSARATKHIALHYGAHFPMWVGCGYPKSGTVWLCQLMSAYLGVPHPRSYVLPIAMSAVLHAHWRYDPRLPQSAYIRRDGRDVMVSLYHYNMRLISGNLNPRRARILHEEYRKALGVNYQERGIRANLPRFIELEMRHPTASVQNWPSHLYDWSAGQANVSQVSYEALRSDPVSTLSALMHELTGDEVNIDRARIAAERFDFGRTTGRQPGTEDVSSFLRKGVVGDWQNHFTREAGEIFDAYAGDALLQHRYVESRDWFRGLKET